MKKKQYDALPKLIRARTEIYLQEAKSLSESWYGMDNGKEIHMLSVQLATAMMNMDAAEVIASEIADFSKQTNKKRQ